MVADHIANATASELAHWVNAGELSPADIVQTLLDRITELDPKVHAWETVDGDGALGAARQLENVSGGLPLKGVPVGIKDIYLTGGLRTTASFPPFANFVPEHEAEAVMRLRRAGAIVLGKTVTTQFALADPPKTRNPWDLERTPGGSSSGSAAAVAARTSPLALGSQTKGSVLRPAAYCGVVGFKPTFGRISRRNIFPLAWSFDTVGIICRSVEDAALSLSVLAGPDPADASSLVTDPGNYRADVRNGLSTPPDLTIVTEFMDLAQPAVREHVHTMALKLQQAGAKIHEVRLPMAFELVNAVHDVIMSSETATLHSQLFARERDGYAPLFRETVEAGQLIPAAAYVHAQRLRRRFRDAMTSLLSSGRTLLTPTVSNTAPGISTTGDPSFQAPWTQIGLPAVSLPSGLSQHQLPVGIQLASGMYAEGRLLQAARWVEEALGPIPAPSV